MANMTMLITEEEIDKRCSDLGMEITKAYEGKSIHVIAVLTGSVFFACELTKYIMRPVTFDFITASSYGNSTESSGEVKVLKDLVSDIEGKDVLIIEDIIDSGRTLKKLKEMLIERKPNSIKICTMLDKPERRVVDVDVDYVAFKIPDKFVVGYGLDYTDGTMRNLPYIATME